MRICDFTCSCYSYHNPNFVVGPNGHWHRVQQPRLPHAISENIRKLPFVVHICNLTLSGYGYHNLNFVVGPNGPQHRVQRPQVLDLKIFELHVILHVHVTVTTT